MRGLSESLGPWLVCSCGMHVSHVGHREPGLAGSGPPLLSIHPRCSVWLRVGEGRVHSGEGALTVGHRVPSRPQEWEAGPATVRRPCQNLTGGGGAWTTRGALKRSRLVIVSGSGPVAVLSTHGLTPFPEQAHTEELA